MRTPPPCQATIHAVNPTPSTSPAAAPSTAPAVAPPVTHYENFPVASLLCPPHLRPVIAAIYAFARTADDIADEGDALPAERLADLAAFNADLSAIAEGHAPSPRWADVFVPLQAVLVSHHLPVPLLADLLSAFAQDVEKTRDADGYADRTELLEWSKAVRGQISLVHGEVSSMTALKASLEARGQRCELQEPAFAMPASRSRTDE